MSETVKPSLPSGLVAFVKHDCPTCVLVAPVLARLACDAGSRSSARTTRVSAWNEDHRRPPVQLSHHGIEVVPTLSADNGEDGRASAGTVANGKS
jgi:hypothetical protein